MLDAARLLRLAGSTQASDGFLRQAVRPLLKSVPTSNRDKLRQVQQRVSAFKGARLQTGMVRRVLDAQHRERMQLTLAATRVKGLMPLLMKPRNGKRWSMAERDELQEQLRALRDLSPYLVILALPGSFLMLPVLAWWLDRRRGDRKIKK